jgi:hypothetical protein
MSDHPVRLWDDRDHDGRRDAVARAVMSQFVTAAPLQATRVSFEFPGVDGPEAHGLLDELADIPTDRRCPGFGFLNMPRSVGRNLTSFDIGCCRRRRPARRGPSHIW